MISKIISATGKAIITLALVAAIAANASAGEADYQKKNSWPETMLAARTAWQAAQSDRGDTPRIQLDAWRIAGPIKSAKGFDQVHFNMASIDFDKGSGGRKWQTAPSLADGIVHGLKGQDGAATYLARIIRTDRACAPTAWFGSDDGLEVWLNGERVLAQDVPRGVSARQASAVLSLKEGENLLVQKIYNRTGSHGFYFSMGDNPFQSLWSQISRDYPTQCRWMARDLDGNAQSWFDSDNSASLEIQMIAKISSVPSNLAASDSGYRLAFYEKTAINKMEMDALLDQIKTVDMEALGRAVRNLTETFPDQYPATCLEKYEALEKKMPEIMKALADGALDSDSLALDLYKFQREALLANPLLDFDRILIVKRKSDQLGLPQNWQGNCAVASTGYDNEIDTLDYRSLTNEPTTLYRPDGSQFVGDVDLHYDAGKMLFSMPGSHGRWQIWEVGIDGQGLRQVTRGEYPDVDNYDACYMPNGRIMFDSTRTFQGVPCVGGSNQVANLFIMNDDGGAVRQLCFDQDHDWYPTVMNNGRILYTRWEYSDTSHYFTRILFHMNPDGSNQTEYYGSNSYWPNSMFYTRPIPGHPTQVVTIVSGHHGVPRMGELIILDPAKGRREADGVIQRIPGYGKKVEPVIVDQLVDDSWPKFLHPYPLSGDYFLVSSMPTPQSNWGIYLVDRFDNMLLLKETPGYALLEPLPLRKTERQPIIPDKVDLNKNTATIYLTDIYEGDGLKGVPRGEVKNLRVYEFHYGYPQMGGHKNVAIEGGWDVHRILGTVPVNEDGSAMFTVPSNMPLAVQPLDEEGRALQVMRSWFVAMPGESLSCVGCHEDQNMTPPPKMTLASRQAPASIKEWHGPTRGFSSPRDLQKPVLEKYCVGCHNEGKAEAKGIPDFSAKDRNGWNNFTPAYLAIHPYVRRPGPESNYHLETPFEYSADTSELVQMLKKGHHNVKLDEEAWDRLYTWIDLNVPDHGTWSEHQPIMSNFHERRMEMRARYADRPEDPEVIPPLEYGDTSFVRPEAPVEPQPRAIECAGWPFDADKAKAMQEATGLQTRRSIDLGDGVNMDLALIPAGAFVMGSNNESPAENPISRIAIDKPFWMGLTEVTNAQFLRFNPNHSNGYINQNHKDHTTPGYPAQDPDMPVIRVTWNEAVAYCDWLSEKTGLKCSLPTEAQWEWACRSGSGEAFSYGDMNADFSSFANLSDLATKLLAVTGVNPQPIDNPSDYEAWIPRDNRFDDGSRIMTATAQYKTNAFGLHDMHGNVAEWTSSEYRPYPYNPSDGRENLSPDTLKTVRGGSWYDRPYRATSAFRWRYPAWQKVYNVGFRVVVENNEPQITVACLKEE